MTVSVFGMLFTVLCASVFWPLPALATKGIQLSGCPCVCDCILTRYLTNRSWEFQQIYNLGAGGDEDELIRF